MSRQHIVPVNTSCDFHIHELFFSTTNEKGIILSGNQVFTRVSNYKPEDMIGKPHNLIRHPDMPRVIFKLLWSYLLAGKPIAAYVKNMASDGRYYWVVALAAPIADGGFLSIRFKPTSPLFSVVADLYTSLRAVEQQREADGGSRQAAMEASEEQLNSALHAHGFADYDAFMQAMVYQELSSRDALLEKTHTQNIASLPPPHKGESPAVLALRKIHAQTVRRYAHINRIYTQLETYAQLNERLRKQGDTILQLTRQFRLTCINLTVTSSRVGEAGRTLSVVATQLGEASSFVGEVVSSLTAQVSKVSTWLGKTVFSLAGARLQFETLIQYYQEIVTTPREPAADQGTDPRFQQLDHLQFAFVETAKSTAQSLRGLGRDLNGLSASVDDLRKGMLLLQVTYVGGMVEACRSTSDGIFRAIFDDIRKHIDTTKADLTALNEALGILNQLAEQTPDIIAVVSDAAREMEQAHAGLHNSNTALQAAGASSAA